MPWLPSPRPPAIVLAEGVSLDEGTLAKAGEEGIAVLATELPVFDIALEIHEAGRPMIPLYYDLHIHSCLSPCGDDDMTPANLVGMAAVKGLDVIALTDHNSCRNCPAAMHHGAEYGVTVISGHGTDDRRRDPRDLPLSFLQDALSFDALIGSKLMPFPNREDIFGKQQIMNEKDEVTGTVENLLINAVSVSFDDVFSLVSEYHGIAYPAHVDKTSPA